MPCSSFRHKALSASRRRNLELHRMDGMLHPERSSGDYANPRSVALMQSICAEGRLEEYRRFPGKTGLSHRASQGQRTLSAGDRSARTAVHGHPEKPHRTDGEQLQRDYWHGQHAPHLKRPFWRFAGSGSFVSFWAGPPWVRGEPPTNQEHQPRSRKGVGR